MVMMVQWENQVNRHGMNPRRVDSAKLDTFTPLMFGQRPGVVSLERQLGIYSSGTRRPIRTRANICTADLGMPAQKLVARRVARDTRPVKVMVISR